MRNGGLRSGDQDPKEWPDVGEIPDAERAETMRRRYGRRGRPWGRRAGDGAARAFDWAGGFEGTEGSFGSMHWDSAFDDRAPNESDRYAHGGWRARARRAGDPWVPWDVPGPFAGIGPQDYQRSDGRIREEICERMTRHGTLDASGIRVDVHAGVVVLEGTVDSRWAKRVAEALADSAAGVRDVNNQLRIEDRVRRAAPRQAESRRREQDDHGGSG